MRTNPIGHTIFVTSEEYRMTNQKTDTIFFTSEKIRIGFSRLSGRPCEVTDVQLRRVFSVPGSEKDPVAAYKLYAKKRPTKMNDSDAPFTSL